MNLNLTAATRIGLNLLALLGVIVALRLGESIFIPLVIALLLATILWSSADRLHTFYRLPWALACLVSVTVLVLVNLVVVGGFVLAVPRLVQDLPADPGQQKKVYKEFRSRVEAMIHPLQLDPQYFPEEPEDSEFFKYVQTTLRNYVPEALLRTGGLVSSWLWSFVLIMFILLFLLLEGRMLTRRVTEVFGPSPEVRAKVADTMQEMTTAVRSYLVWRTVINIALGVVVGLAYQALGLRQSWTWALLTAVLCYIPYLGPIIAGIPPVLDAFVHVSPWAAVGVVVFFTLLVTLEGYLIVPVVMGRNMDLNATTVMLACLFWDLVWGTPGLFLAMPLMAAIKSICDHVPGWKPWANLMSADDADAPAADALKAGFDPTRTMVMVPPIDVPAARGDKVTR
jgi:predicted PurR-regulated permease PerM